MTSWGYFFTLWTIWALSIMLGSLDAKMDPPCDKEKQYKHDQRCCNKCPPGKHMEKKCSPTSDTLCRSCSSNEYMSVWNDDVHCNSHMLCDPGKALQVLHNGNSTYARICVCTEGYHFDTKQDICMENTNCAPGFGVRSSVHRNQNTECIPCEEGYFSNSSSSTEQCQPWTNCTKLGLEEKLRGTSKADAVCESLPRNNLSQVVIPIIVFVLSIAALILVMCCRKKYSSLKVAVHDWVQERCDKLCGSEKKSPYSEADMIQPKCDYIKIAPLPTEESFSPLYNNQKEIEIAKGRMIPTEDEYMDQRKSSEPENGVESLSDLECPSLGTLPTDSDDGSDRMLFFKEDVRTQSYSEPQCHQSAKESLRKRQEKPIQVPIEKNYGQNNSCHGIHIHPHADSCIPEKNADDDDSFSYFSNSQYTRSSSRDSTDSISTSETPTSPSGNVTGNNNTTVISSAPVMNIKTDVVVVYYRGCFEDAHTTSENEENMKRPMQEEKQDHCDSFVANAQPYRYTDAHCCSNPNMDCTEAVHIPRDPSCSSMSCQDFSDNMYSNNTDFLPVQEEGKPEYYHSEIV